MFIIIDANVASEFPERTAEAKAIVVWIKNRGKLSTGGKNLEELFRTKIRVFVQEIIKAGRGTIFDNTKIVSAEKQLNGLKCRSDDPHVLGLALVSGARLLYTRDINLSKDFTDINIIPIPKGKCYKNCYRHRHLLT